MIASVTPGSRRATVGSAAAIASITTLGQPLLPRGENEDVRDGVGWRGVIHIVLHDDIGCGPGLGNGEPQAFDIGRLHLRTHQQQLHRDVACDDGGMVLDQEHHVLAGAHATHEYQNDVIPPKSPAAAVLRFVHAGEIGTLRDQPASLGGQNLEILGMQLGVDRNHGIDQFAHPTHQRPVERPVATHNRRQPVIQRAGLYDATPG